MFVTKFVFVLAVRCLDILQPLHIHRGNDTQFPNLHNMQLPLLCRQFLFLLRVLSVGILQLFHIHQEIERDTSQVSIGGGLSLFVTKLSLY